MSSKKHTPGGSARSGKPSKAERAPQLEVNFKLLLPAHEEPLRDMINATKWKNLVRELLHTLQDWRDYSEGAESRAYDGAVKFLRGELATNGLTLADPDLVEDEYRRARTFWWKAINKRWQAAEMAGSSLGSAPVQLEKLVASGEMEATKAALDFAFDHGLAHGGWCKPGKPSEEGPLDDRYQLSEMPGATPPEIAERNIVESDATMIVTVGLELGRLARVRRLAKKHRKPCLHVSSFAAREKAAAIVRHFLGVHRPRVLNVVAHSAVEEPDAAHLVRTLLASALLTSPDPA